MFASPKVAALVQTIDPRKEILSGKFCFESKMNAGRLMKNLTMDVEVDGWMSPTTKSPLDLLNFELSKKGVCIPTANNLIDWCEFRVGRDWYNQPEQVAKVLGLKVPLEDKTYYVASSSLAFKDGLRRREFMILNKNGVKLDFPGSYLGECYMPIFFGRRYYEGIILDAVGKIAD